MNLTGWNDIDRAALRSFYEAGNQWSWEDLESGAAPAARAAREWIETSSPPRGHPLLLPRVQGVGVTQCTNWYAIAFNEAQAEELREHLSAFIGSAGTDFSGRRADLDPADIAESALAAWAGGPWVYRFAVLSGNRDVVRYALQRLQQVWRLRPPLPTTVFRTTEALLREFFSALVNQDEAGAVGWLGELRAGGRLSAENLVFLEIERLAAFGRWHELVALPQVALLTLMRRPRHITALLIEALWRTEFADYVVRGDAAGAVVRFRSDFYPRYQNLLRTRGSLTSAPVALTFLLAAVTSDPPRREQIPVLLELLVATPHQSFAETLAALVPADTLRTPEDRIETPLQRARFAFQQDDYDTALLHLRQAPPSPEACSLLLECAAESQSVDDARAVSDCFAALSPQEQHRVLSSIRRRRAWEDLQRLLIPSAAVIPTDWEGWLSCLDAHEYSELLSLAREAAVEWPLVNYLNDPQRVRLLAERLMADRNEEAQEVLRLAFPHLLGYFLKDGHGDPAFLHLYRTLLLLLGVSERFTSEDWPTCQTLLIAILDAGADTQAYSDTVGALREIWVRFGSAVRFDWAFDTLDLLVANPTPAAAAESRDAFFDAVRDRLSKDYRRVCPEHWETFRWLATDLDRTIDFEALQPKSEATAAAKGKFADSLAGKMVAVYTLTESAGARAKSLLEHLFPGLEVRLNHDHGGTEKLKSLARESDYFVVATRSATHAATDFLKSQRPKGKSGLIYPTGKGSSSIVTSLTTALRLELS